MGFAMDLTKAVERRKDRMGAIVRKVVIDVGARVVMRSPVGDATLWQSPPPPGYVGGRFRANWQYGFNAAPVGDLPDIGPSGEASNKRIRIGVMAAPAAGMHYLANNLPYAMRLENGHSGQAPHGMVGLTIVEFRNIVQGVAQA